MPGMGTGGTARTGLSQPHEGEAKWWTSAVLIRLGESRRSGLALPTAVGCCLWHRLKAGY